MAERYNPPKQSGGGQFFDSLFVLVLVYAALLAPVVLGLTASAIGGEGQADKTAVTWESLGQNETMQAQWEKLGVGVEEAASMITSRFDYSFSPLLLLVTAVLIIGYFVFLVKVSDREYREVISEKFGD